MTTRTFPFTFALGHSGRAIPEWKFRDLVKAEATQAAILELHGPLSPGVTIDDAFRVVGGALKDRAARKIEDSNGDFEEPVIVDVGDL